MELFKLFGTIVLDNTNANHGIDETADKAEKAHPKIAKAFSKIGDAAVKAGKVIASGLAVGATAMGKLTLDALNMGGELEQNMGGSEAVFGEYAESMQKTASAAFSQMGLSASDFLATANKMGALFQGAGFGIEESASLSAEAMQRAADVASIMGIDVSDAMEAIAGAAKGNFTMMDNLGVAMNDTAIQNYALSKGIQKSTAQMTQQEKIGLAMEMFLEKTAYAAGNYSKENDTLAGSLATAKAAFTNFMSGAGDVDGLVDALLNAGNVIVRNLQTLLPRLTSGLNRLISQLLPYVPTMMEALLPGIIEGAVILALGLAQMLPSLVEMVVWDLPYLISKALYNSTSPAVSALGDLFWGISEFWGEVLLPAIMGVGQALGGLWQSIQPILAIFPQLFAETTGITKGFDIFRIICWAVEDVLQIVGQKVNEVATWISDHSEEIKSAITKCWQAVQDVWNSVGQPIFDLIQDAIAIVRNAFAERMPEIKEFVSGCFEDIGNFWNNNLKPCFEAIGNFIETYLAPIFKAVFETQIKGIVDTVFNAIRNLWNNTLKPVFKGITDFLTGVFTGNWRQAWNGIVNIFKGIINIIPTALESVINGAISLVNGLIRGINKISSAIGLGEIKLISKVSLPKLEKGGILEKGQVGLLEGSGAEAVVPLDRNQAWINAVAKDMQAAGIGGKSDVLEHYFQQLIDMLADYFPQLLEAAGHDIVTNDGVIVAHYAPMLNSELGKISTRKGRGR